MKPLNKLDKQTILADEIFDEIFDQEDEIARSRLILSLEDRAAELGVKRKFETLLKAFAKVRRETRARGGKKLSSGMDNYTCFDGPYENMYCGSWIAGEDGIYAQNMSNVEQIACYHPILPIERLKNLETGEEQIRLAFKRSGRWEEIIVPKVMITSASKIVALSGRGRHKRKRKTAGKVPLRCGKPQYKPHRRTIFKFQAWVDKKGVPAV